MTKIVSRISSLVAGFALVFAFALLSISIWERVQERSHPAPVPQELTEISPEASSDGSATPQVDSIDKRTVQTTTSSDQKKAAFEQLKQRLHPGDRAGKAGEVLGAFVRNQFVEEDFHIRLDDYGNVIAPNPAFGFEANFSDLEEGNVRILSHEAEGELHMRLAKVGPGHGLGVPIGLAVDSTPRVEGDRIEYARAEEITEWFINGEDGLEQGWTLESPIAGSEDTGRIEFEIAFDAGNLLAVSRGGGRNAGVGFHDETGREVFSYDKLRVFDATGRELPSQLQKRPVVGDGGTTVTLTAQVRNATYPITIDPVVASKVAGLRPRRAVTSAAGLSSGFVELNGELYFSAYVNNLDFNEGVWKTDGTVEGTVLIEDGFLNPPDRFVVFNGKVYFAGQRGFSEGPGLFATDGTSEGTEKIASIAPANRDTFTPLFYEYNGHLYFSASGSDPNQQNELWRTDGTASGTELFVVIDPGAGFASPQHFVEYDGLLYFQAFREDIGLEIWRTDGTFAGTAPFIDLNPGAGSSAEFYSIVYDGELYFNGNDGTFGEELWKTDGTVGGTVRVTDENPGLGDFSPWFFVEFGGLLYFGADGGTDGRELWSSDGTAGNTMQVADINPGSNGSNAAPWAVFNGKILLSADDGTTFRELWTSDGTGPGTTLLKNIDQNDTTVGGFVRPGIAFGGKWFFTAFGHESEEIWTTDGTTGNTELFIDLNAGSAFFPAGTPSTVIEFDGDLYFMANDGMTGREIWKSDGTPSGTMLIKDVRPGPAGSFPRGLTVVDNEVFFYADDGVHGLELWKTDGSNPGTVLVKDINPGASSAAFHRLTSFDGKCIFRAYEPTFGRELWISDGTSGGTQILKDLNPSSNSTLSSFPNFFTEFIGELFFVAQGDLWKTDGTTVGTIVVKDNIFPNTRNGSVGKFTEYNGNLYFYDGDDDLWKTDGTTGGTVAVTSDLELVIGAPDQIPFGVVYNGILYFVGNQGDGNELFRTDGTTGGTFLVKNFNPDLNSNPDYMTVFNGELFFQAAVDADLETFATNYELVKTDGTEVGTVAVPAADPNLELEYPRYLTVFNGTLYFLAEDKQHGLELWKTDGTQAGTVLVEDLAPGIIGSNPSALFAAEGLTGLEDALYYFAGDVDGTEYLLKLTDAPMDLDAGSDTGISSTDDVTSDFTPEFFGVTDPNATVEIFSDIDGSVATTSADGSGNWSVTANPMSEGEHRLIAQIDGIMSGGSLLVTIDTTPPDVTVEKAAGQEDPAAAGPVEFVAAFNEDVFDFAAVDVTAGGNAAGIVDVTGGPSTFTLSVEADEPEGIVNAAIPMNVCTDAAGNLNNASTSTDNEVALDPDGASGSPNQVTFTNEQSANSGFLTSPTDTDTFTFTLTGPRVVMLQTTGGTDTIGTLRDADGNIVNVPGNDENSGTGSNFLVSEFLPPGTYTIEVSGNGTGAYDLEIDAQTPFTIQPDLITQGRGGDIYGGTGGQTFVARSRKAKRVRAAFGVENDGEIPDNIRVSGGRGNKFFRVSYVSSTNGNVSGALLAGTYELAAVAQSAADQVSVTIRPNKKRLKKVKRKRNGKRVVKFLRKSISLNLRATSQAWTNQTDSGLIRVKVK